MSVETLGFVAGGVCASALFPQVWQCLRSGSTRDISWGMMVLNLIGVSLYFLYGVLINNNVIFINMLISMLLTCTLMGLKIYFEHIKPAPVVGTLPEERERLAPLPSAS